MAGAKPAPLKSDQGHDRKEVTLYAPFARSYRYFLNVAAAMHTATPSSAALCSRISSGFTLTGSAR